MRSYATNIFRSSIAKSLKTAGKELLAFEKAKDVFYWLCFKVSPSAAVDLEQLVLNHMAFQPSSLPAFPLCSMFNWLGAAFLKQLYSILNLGSFNTQ